MNRNQREVIRRVRIVAAVEAQSVDVGGMSEQAKSELVEQWVFDEQQDERREAAEDREQFGEPEDTLCIQSADVLGTGEGRFHGLIN